VDPVLEVLGSFDRYVGCCDRLTSLHDANVQVTHLDVVALAVLRPIPTDADAVQ